MKYKIYRMMDHKLFNREVTEDYYIHTVRGLYLEELRDLERSYDSPEEAYKAILELLEHQRTEDADTVLYPHQELTILPIIEIPLL